MRFTSVKTAVDERLQSQVQPPNLKLHWCTILLRPNGICSPLNYDYAFNQFGKLRKHSSCPKSLAATYLACTLDQVVCIGEIVGCCRQSPRLDQGLRLDASGIVQVDGSAQLDGQSSGTSWATSGYRSFVWQLRIGYCICWNAIWQESDHSDA